MVAAFFTGFFLGISLIVAIGAQNTFVLRQGIIGKHVFYVALFCALSDAILISIGVAGISFLLNSIVSVSLEWLFGFAALWLAVYGLIILISAFRSNKVINIEEFKSKDLSKTLGIIAILTFANPHVYLDTMVLIGSISQQFNGINKFAFAFGASIASFMFFFSLAYGAKLLSPLMSSKSSWRILDIFIAVIMFTISFKLASAGQWL